MNTSGIDSPPEDRSSSNLDSEEWAIEAANTHGVRTYVVTDSDGLQRYAHEDQLPGWVVKALGPEWLAEFARTTPT